MFPFKHRPNREQSTTRILLARLRLRPKAIGPTHTDGNRTEDKTGLPDSWYFESRPTNNAPAFRVRR
jgi:hypothetical protein